MHESPEADRFRARPLWFARWWGLPDPVVLWRFHGAKHDLRGLVFVTSFGYGFGLELADQPIWFQLQPSLERLVDFANGTNRPENLVWLCLRHHNAYDRQARQAKGFTQHELLAHRAALLEYLQALPAPWADARTPIKLSSRRRPLPSDVYDRKIPIYRAVRDLIIKAAQNATIEWPELFAFNRATDEAIFMFGIDVDEYLKELHRKCIELHTTHVELSSPSFGMQPGQDRAQTASDNAAVLLWFTKQLDVARQLFSRYLYI
jgi:hypothetical protein